STAIGSLNMVWGAKQETVEKNPELIKLIMDIHRKATEYAMANESAKVEMAVQKLGQTRKSIELASPNVELTWKIDDEFIKRAKAYAQLMHEKKQIREIPNFDKFITTKFMPTAVASAR
ncbi:MAG TPA: ABC transporter substrate-binding protein, partial [Burkholderiales bacterium]|nr:ABC transporter substrate-binding protein [Burkholderiales bacterium]